MHKKLASRDQSAHVDRTKRLIEQEKQREEVFLFTVVHKIYKRGYHVTILFIMALFVDPSYMNHLIQYGPYHMDHIIWTI